MENIKQYIKLIRVKQWIKNFFVFFALIFSNNLTNITYLNYCLKTFLSFCLVSSAIYIINDIVDKEKDKVHSIKQYRPIASGKTPISLAIILSVIFIVCALTIAYFVNINIIFILLLYILNNLIYTFIGKNLVIIDIVQIAIGFILRVIAGAIAIGVYTSTWIILCTFFVSLFLGFGKRRNEILSLGESSKEHRENLRIYTVEILNQFLVLTMSCTIIFYALYTIIGTQYKYMWITNIFVIIGILKYYLLINNEDDANPADVVLKDKSFIFCILLWMISSILTIML